MKPDRAPSSIWLLRRDKFYPAVRTAAGDQVILEDGEGNWLNMSRTDARLFAKRINECLDATVKR